MKSGVADGSRRGGYPYLRTSYQHPPGHGIISADGPEQLRLIPTTWSCAIAVLRPRVHGSYAIHFAHPGAPECSAFSPPRGIPLRRIMAHIMLIRLTFRRQGGRARVGIDMGG